MAGFGNMLGLDVFSRVDILGIIPNVFVPSSAACRKNFAILSSWYCLGRTICR